MPRVCWLVSLTVVLAALAPGRMVPAAATRPAAGWGATPLVVTSGALGGATADMAVLGHYLVFGAGPSVLVADMAVPTQPRLVGRTPLLGGLVAAIAVAGDRAYVAAGPAGLVVVDLSVPERPRITAVVATPESARDVVLSGGRALVAAEGAGLVVVDVTTPDRPRVLGAYHTGYLAAGVATAFGHAYVLTVRRYTYPGDPSAFYDLAEDIEVFDLAGAVGGGPTATFGASDVVGAPPGPLAVAGTSLLVGVGRLTVYDLAAPGQPVRLADLDTGAAPRDIAVLAGGRQVLVAGGFGHPDSGEVTRVDLTDPRHPALVGVWYTSEAGQATVATAGGLVYLNRAEGGIDVVSLDQQPPNGPVQPAGTLPGLAAVTDVAARAGRTYLALGVGGLAVAQTGPDGALTVVGQTPAGSGGAVVVYTDVTLPAGPDDAPPTRAFVLSVHGDVASAAVRVLDVADPAQPRELGKLTTTVVYRALAVGARYAYAGRADSLDVIDAADPAGLKVTSTVPVTGGIEDLVLLGDKLYATTGGRMAVFDLAMPEKPRLDSALTLPGTAKVVAVRDGLAYVAAVMPGSLGRLTMVDVSEPRSLKVKAVVALPAPPTAILADGPRVLVGVRTPGGAAADDGPAVLTLAPDAITNWPRLVGRAALAAVPLGLAADGARARVAAGDGGLLPLTPGTVLSLPVVWR